ncbi:MAG TPA: ABC transporter substrate-binding protein [Phycisphaerales bacterium]|nr:ABC transporter substrate-binding protein [Phycisphaerales bacterium]
MHELTRRLAIGLLASAGAAWLSGCGKGDAGGEQGGAAGGTSGGGAIQVGFAQIGAEGDWRRANSASIQAAADKRGIDLIFVDAQGKQENQIKAIRNFIVQGVDVIAFSPVVETGWEPVLREVKDAGIPVVLTDRVVEVSDPDLYVTFIGADFVEEGRRAAAWLAEAAGGEARIAELQGTPGSAPAIDRKKGFEEGIAQHPGMQVIKSQAADFTRAKGREVMESFLKSPEGKEITALYAHNDDMAIGAIQAIEEAGLRPGVDIKIVSIDGVRAAFEAMVAGKLNCTVECNPLLGPQLFDAVEAIAAAREVPRRVVTEAVVFTQATAAEDIKTRQY